MNTLVQHYLQKTQLLLFYFILITYPLNLFYNLFPTYGYAHGLQIDYLLPKLYLSQIGIVCLLALYTLQRVLTKKAYPYPLSSLLFPLPLVVFFLIRSFFTPFPLASLFFTLQIIFNLSFGIWIWHNRSLLSTKVIYFTLLSTILFQILLGILQFTTQHAIFPYRYLGETQIQHSVGIAKSNFSKFEKITGKDLGLRILPHGTFPHPNVLAGFVVLNLLIILRVNSHRVVRTGITVMVVSFLIITGSFSATLALFIGVLFICGKSRFQILNKQKKQMYVQIVSILSITMLITVPFLLAISSQSMSTPSISRRQTLNAIAMDIIKENPLFGIGLNQFTTQVETYARNSETISFVQPAHHVPLLLLSEVGIVGLAILVYGVGKFIYGKQFKFQFGYWHVAALCILIPLITLDHYLYTLHQGQLLVIIFFLFFGIKDTLEEKRI